jgi:hypothetical protein
VLLEVRGGSALRLPKKHLLISFLLLAAAVLPGCAKVSSDDLPGEQPSPVVAPGSISSCFAEGNRNRVVYAAFEADGFSIQLETGAKIWIRDPDPIKGGYPAEMFVEVSHVRRPVRIFDPSTSSHVESWGQMLWERATVFGDCAVFFVRDEARRRPSPVLVNTRSGTAQILGQGQFKELDPQGFVFSRNEILIGRWWSGDIVGFSDQGVRYLSALPFSHFPEDRHLSDFFEMGGVFYVGFYHTVVGYSWAYFRLYRVPDLNAPISQRIIAEEDRLGGSVYDSELDHELGVLMDTFVYVDADTYTDYQFGLVNRRGEFKPFGKPGPYRDARIRIVKESADRYVVSWYLFEERLEVRIDGLGNLL